MENVWGGWGCLRGVQFVCAEVSLSFFSISLFCGEGSARLVARGAWGDLGDLAEFRRHGSGFRTFFRFPVWSSRCIGFRRGTRGSSCAGFVVGFRLCKYQ